MAMMRAMVLEEFGAPLGERTVPRPVPKEREVLLKVKACGLCGTDLKITAGTFPGIRLPRIIGHEVAGEVVAKGELVDAWRVGDRAVVYFYLSCGRCEHCLAGREALCLNLTGRVGMELDGGLGEYLALPETSLLKLPPDIAYPSAAILPDGVATVWRALSKKVTLSPGHWVGITGIGGLGIHAVQLAKLLGARVIAIDLAPAKLAAAAQAGADHTVCRGDDFSQEVFDLTGGTGVQVMLDLVGLPATQQTALRCLKPGGQLVLVGYVPGRHFAVTALDLILGEKGIVASRASSKQDLREVIGLVAAGKVAPMVSEALPVAAANQALAKLAEGGVVGRIVLVA